MKRIITVYLICTLLLFTTINSYADYNDNPLGFDEEQMDDLLNEEIMNSVSVLNSYDIVREPFAKWSKDDNISRRNAFEMIYIVYTRGHRLIESIPLPDKYSPFDDVEYDTYDYYLGLSLYENGIMTGKLDADGNCIADFDSYITYYEAFTMISRIFGNHYGYSHAIFQSLQTTENDQYPYYTFCREIGLINSNNRINYSTLTVTPEVFNQPILAYEFMHLLHLALYVSTVQEGGIGGTIYGFRYIDCFVIVDNEAIESRNADSDFSNLIP